MIAPARFLDEPQTGFRSPGSDAAEEVVTLIDRLLKEQRTLTAVETFARRHAEGPGNIAAERYRDLIPLSRPRPGEQYAFEVDLDRCSGCKACVASCHSLNGLDDGESWRDVGAWIGELRGTRGPAVAEPIQLTVTTACHHCLDPGCLLGCPVLAYEKDPQTGIVRHLDDQCIGCSYCVMKCPYDVPKYSARRGIVRKCDLCHGRLAEGEAPACAQACPSEAIRVTVVDVKSVRAEAGSSWFPDAPDPRVTLPSTRYISRRPVSELCAMDRGVARAEPPHWPLVFMLVLTQAAAGLFIAAPFLQSQSFGAAGETLHRSGLALLFLGLMAASFHLGQPLKAWRAFLGWRTSWLSREILAFGLLATLASAVALVPLLPFTPRIGPALGALTGCVGLVAVFASAMVYIDTRRPFWGPWPTLGQFGGTTALLGTTFTAALLAWFDRFTIADLTPAVHFAAIAALIIRTGLFGWRGGLVRTALNAPQHPLHRSARFIEDRLQVLGRARVALFVISTAAGLIALLRPPELAAGWATTAAIATLASEIAARYVYFVAVAPDRMPGGVAG